jgi:hypothetical protein
MRDGEGEQAGADRRFRPRNIHRHVMVLRKNEMGAAHVPCGW